MVEQIKEIFVDPGITSFADDPAGLQPYLTPVLENASLLVPAGTRIYAAATAGMRILTEQDPEAAAALLGELEAVLRDSAFDFRDGDAEVMTGMVEGAYGWVATNVITGTITGTEQLCKTRNGKFCFADNTRLFEL